MYKWDLPVNFEVLAPTEQEAEQMLADEIHKMIKRRGLEELIDFDFVEFIPSQAGDNV